MPERKPPTLPLSPLLPTTAPCPTCGAWLLIREWVAAMPGQAPYWRELAAPVSPVLGLPHHCQGDPV